MTQQTSVRRYWEGGETLALWRPKQQQEIQEPSLIDLISLHDSHCSRGLTHLHSSISWRAKIAWCYWQQGFICLWWWYWTKPWRMWVDGKGTRKKPIKCGVNLDKGVEERTLIFIFSLITHRASVKNEDGYKRESSSTDCAKVKKWWRVPLGFGPLWAASCLWLVFVFTGKTWFYGSGRGGHSSSFFGLCNEMSFWQIYKALIRKGRWGVCFIWSRHHAARDLV